MNAELGLRMTDVPYKGAAPAITDLIRGEIQVFCALTVTALPLARDGRAKLIAIMRGGRSEQAPEIPTFAEPGFPEGQGRRGVRRAGCGRAIAAILRKQKMGHGQTTPNRILKIPKRRYPMFEEKRTPRLLFPALQPLYDSITPLAWPLVRCASGLILAVHGWGKVSKGPETFVPLFSKMGLEPALLIFWTLLVVEFIGGICMAAGLLTRFWAAAITIEMLVIVNIYIPNGFGWLARGYEYALLWGLVSLAIWMKGGGEYSIDRKFGVEL
jgi:putative oxidoreductase